MKIIKPLYDKMERIQINCDKCNINKHMDATLIDLNYDTINKR